MFSLTITEKGGTSNVRDFDQDEVTIGRIQGNDIVLPKSNISKRHARIINNGGQFVVIDSKSTNGTYINGKRIDAPYDLKAGDKIFVGDFTLEIASDAADEGADKKKSAPPPPPDDEDRRETKAAKEGDVLDDEDWGEGGADLSEDWDDDWGPEGDGTSSIDAEAAAKPRRSSGRAGPDVDDELAALEAELAQSRRPKSKARPKAKEAPKTTTNGKDKALGKSPAKPKAKAKVRPLTVPDSARRTAADQDGLSDAARASRIVHERLLRSLDLRRMNVESMDDDELRARTRESVEEIIAAMEKEGALPKSVRAKALLETVLDEALGLGPLEELLADEVVTEIMVNGAKQIYVERGGKLEVSDRTFSSDQAVMGCIERIVAPIGRRIDESSPMVDARLKDGSRVNAIIPPLSLHGPTLTIRKFTKEPLQVKDLVGFGTLTREMAGFLETCVKARKNVLISGGTGSGKTTTLNVLSAYIPTTERIITIEDAAELKLGQDHVVSLESRPPNIEGRGAIVIRDLVRNALRMRPDRIVIGECRGGEALDMLQAMNTGHDGSLTTVHANGPRDALARLETMVLMSGMELPVRAIRDQIASAINIIVQQTRFPDGSRRVTHISEVTGMEADVISMQDIFVFEQEGFDDSGKVAGKSKATGAIPRFYESLRAMGIDADLSIFQ